MGVCLGTGAPGCTRAHPGRQQSNRSLGREREVAQDMGFQCQGHSVAWLVGHPDYTPSVLQQWKVSCQVADGPQSKRVETTSL